MGYRKEIYSNYATNFHCESRDNLNIIRAHRWEKAYNYYFRNWLPSDKNSAIIDLGCGSGRLLRFFKARGYTNLSGVDISPEQVLRAKSVIQSIKEEDILTFLEGRHNEFDLVTGIDIIEHLTKEDGITLLKLCYLTLKPGGRIILQTPNADSPMFSTIWYGDITHETGYNTRSIKSLIQHVGFKSIEARETGPLPIDYGVKTGVRFFLWKLLRIAAVAWNLIETGHSGSNVYTRALLISAVKY